MKQPTKTLLKALLAKNNQEEQLLRFLPSTLAQEIEGYSKPESFVLPKILSQTLWIESIHFSWFVECLKNIPHDVQALCCHLLTSEQKKGLSQTSGVSFGSLSTSPFIHAFLNHFLNKQLEKEEVIDKSALPASPLNKLLNLTRAQLIYLINLLGIYDLAADLRLVVDKNLLEAVYACLTQEQMQFLHYCTKLPLKWVPPKLGLSSWDRSKHRLQHLLHHRGLIRLGRAVFQEDPSFKWYLLHQLDTGRAKIIQKEFTHKQDVSLISYFKNQVLHILNKF